MTPGPARPPALPPPTPWGDLLHARRKDRVPALTARKAARLAGISPTTWRNIERGYKILGAGIMQPYKGAAEYVARMAAILGVSAEDLKDTGRADAARVLAILGEARPSYRIRDTITAAVAMVGDAQDWPGDVRDRLRAEITRIVDEAG